METKWFMILVRKPFKEMGDWNSIFEDCESYAVYEHTQDQGCKSDHLHMLISFMRKEDTLRKRIKALGFAGKDFAVSTKGTDGQVVNDTFLTYMSKGKFYPKVVGGFDDTLLEQRRSEWVDRESTVRLQGDKLVKESKEVKVKTKKQLLELMVAEIPDISGTREILNGIRKVLVKENQVIGMYKMMDYYDSYMLYERKESWIDGMVAKINSRLGI